MTNSPAGAEDASGSSTAVSNSSSSSNRSGELRDRPKPGESQAELRARDDEVEHDREEEEEEDPQGNAQVRADHSGLDDHPGTSGGSRTKPPPPPPPASSKTASTTLDRDRDCDDGDDEDDEGDDRDQAAGSFDCNICLELAQDPVVTLCGHLFCWPCLYKWTQLRSICKECPVCKAPVHEDKVIPLYGRGCVESSSDHRDHATSSVPEMEIPSRPPGQRSGSSSDPHHQASLAAWHHHARRLYDPYGIGFVAGAAAGPGASARFGNVTFSAGFGLFPSLFRLQFHGFPDAPPPGPAMLPYGGLHTPPPPPASYHHHHHHQLRALPPPLRPDQQETLLSRLLLFVGGVMILCFLYF
ncbi:RING finger protein 5-like [Selaginella moellendorffii]|nr:RING finger protein 5-like [Selaginella moellendorffii]|eukprot:XP_024520187.1 RING finger protein 5-like [Selaginella moellendorffii]